MIRGGIPAAKLRKRAHPCKAIRIKRGGAGGVFFSARRLRPERPPPSPRVPAALARGGRSCGLKICQNLNKRIKTFGDLQEQFFHLRRGQMLQCNMLQMLRFPQDLQAAAGTPPLARSGANNLYKLRNNCQLLLATATGIAAQGVCRGSRVHVTCAPPVLYGKGRSATCNIVTFDK